ncbi:MAG: acetyl-CoA carboxylase biotin carboxyl carrier protein [Hyphomonadaceae bacterium]
MSDKKPASGIDPALVQELANILSDSGLTEIELQHGELKLKLVRAHAPAAAAPAQIVHHAPVAALPPPSAAPAPAAPEAPGDDRSHPGAVTSPMVGTAYLSPEPDAPAYVKVGDNVSEGQTLMIVEAMKTFNPITAPRAGKVSKICVTNGQPVEFGTALVIVE